MTGKTLNRKIERFCAWYKIIRALLVLQVVLFIGCSLLGIYILCDRLFYVELDLSLGAACTAILILLSLLAFYLFADRRIGHVTYLVDKNSGLKNLVGSGLSVMDASDEISQVLMDRADAALSKRHPTKTIPLKLNWGGRFIYIPALVLLISFLLPEFDLLGRKEERERIAEEKAVVKKGALKLTAKLTAIEKKVESAKTVESRKIVNDFNGLAEQLMGVAKEDALTKLGEFEAKYRKEFSKQREFEKIARNMSQKPNLDGLHPDSQKDLKKLMNNLKQGNFKDSAKAMRDLAKQMQDDKLSSDQKQALAREMQKLAKNMQNQGSSQQMAEMMQKMQASQDQSLEELMKQCQQAGKQMNEMANFMEDAENMQAMNEGMNEAKQEMLGDSFSDFDAKEVEQYMDEQAALGGGMGTSTGEGQNSGGTGGEGHGRGGEPPENATDTAFKTKMTGTKLGKGKILHQLFVSGIPEKGEAFVEYTDVARAAKQRAASSLANESIPREYEKAVKDYFDSLEIKKPE